jgi:hypothetical protein
MATLKTLVANLKHGAYNQQNANIGGGLFSPAEQLELAQAIERRELLLRKCFAHLNDIDDPDWRPWALIEEVEKELT